MLGTQHGRLYMTRHVAPDQARFEPEYFIALTEDGLTLFNLIGQCFQEVGLTEWNKVVGKQCPDNTNLAEASFKEWTQDYQRQSPGCPIKATNWFVGFALQRSLHSCWYMNSCNNGHSYSATLTMATSIKQWSCQQRRIRANRSSSHPSRCISTSSETNKTVLPPSLCQKWKTQ
jgi:hypothetical protein